MEPTKVDDQYWMSCEDPKLSKRWPHDDGKWMMFIPKERLDEVWQRAQDFYLVGKLTGISRMKVSTAKDNPRASDDSTGVIIFYCGPSDDEEIVLEYGRNLLRLIPYTSPNGYMYYKSDAQTSAGTRATGCTKNSLYKLEAAAPIPNLASLSLESPGEEHSLAELVQDSTGHPFEPSDWRLLGLTISRAYFKRHGKWPSKRPEMVNGETINTNHYNENDWEWIKEAIRTYYSTKK